MQLLQQELPTLPGQIFSGVRVTRSLVLCVCFVDRCLSFFVWPLCCLSFDFRILITFLDIKGEKLNFIAIVILIVSFELQIHLMNFEIDIYR